MPPCSEMAEPPRQTDTLAAAPEPAAAPDSLRLGGAELPADLPAEHASLLLASGRRYELTAGERADQLVVRGRGGDVVLRIDIGDHGPVLSFSAATLDLSATRSLHLAAPRVSIEADESVTVSTRGALVERAASHHSRVTGEERLEAGSMELQANDGHLRARARRRIAFDAAHIGLNDDPLPTPFDWSAAAEEELP